MQAFSSAPAARAAGCARAQCGSVVRAQQPCRRAVQAAAAAVDDASISSTSSRSADAATTSAAAATSAAAVGRRAALALGAALALVPAACAPTSAAGFRKELKKRKVPLEEYAVSAVDGLRYYDVAPGRGQAVAKGDQATVHFDCVYRGIDAVSSRYARTLGGNRTVAEPFALAAGFPLPTVAERMAASGSGGGGLFAGGTGPQPPPALATAVLGMRPGGRRIVYVDAPDLGYAKGNQEIPAGGTFELKIEMLSVVAGRP
jgi:peptidylprolyl isomerase